jgi:hypothetical protein
MGNKVATQAVHLNNYLHELSEKIVYDQPLGNGRFLRTIKCQCLPDEGAVVVKVYVKLQQGSLREYVDKLTGTPPQRNLIFALQNNISSIIVHLFGSFCDLHLLLLF